MAGTLDLGKVVGDPGQGIPVGGAAGKALFKRSATDYDTEWGDAVKSVNNETPDENGNVEINEVDYAKNFVSDDAQQCTGEFLVRTTGGDASIADGDAWLSFIRGRQIHTGYIAQSVNMTVTAAERQEGETAIIAEIDEDDFIAAASGTSGTMTFTYDGTAWNTNPADYGITVNGTPVEDDEISVVYQKEVRGTITVSNPSSFISTGWNLYNHTNGYARVLKYSESYGFLVGGTYTSLQFSSTLTGERSSLTPVGGYFAIPSDGYVWVNGGNNTDTYILMTWSDWTNGPDGEWEEYEESTISLSTVMANFPNGLMQVGSIADEIDLNAQTAISRIERLTYSAANLASVKASGRAYDYDENYIYVVRSAYVTYDITLDGSYSASDHGLEMIGTSTVAVQVQTLYGQNLKDKLRTDVVTISSQQLSSAQKTQVRTNIGAASAEDVTTLSDQIANLLRKTTVIKTDVTLSAGTKGYLTITYTAPSDLSSGDQIVDVSAQTTGVGAISGLQLTRVYTSTSEIDFEYYAPNAINNVNIPFVIKYIV